MTHTLITGGAGFIGSHMAEALLAKGDAVTVVDDLSTGRFENIQPLVGKPGFRFAIETITNETVMDRLGSECDRILHLAAAVGVKLIMENPVETIETNVLGTEVVLRAAERFKRRILITSTSEVYGKAMEIPNGCGKLMEENDLVLGPTSKRRWAYACSKALDEFLALAYHDEKGLPVIIARLFNTVGPRQTGRYGMVIPTFVESALAGNPLPVFGDGNQSRSFTHVHDVVWALIALMDCRGAEGQIFNIGSGEEITVNELAKKVIEFTNSTSTVEHIPYERVYGKGFEDMERRYPDLAKIKKFTGYCPKWGIDDIIKSVIEYYEK
ncbi:MAG: NAD-dependent epimerase/dehydratase family protein [Spirochaetales bacterium]|nr:MAG: NAD-dependent epimerase/dehydratase family protein [Spirochaetales bacterium]